MCGTGVIDTFLGVFTFYIDSGFGQRRILLVGNRLVFPNGRSIVLERQPGTDAQGYAGLEDGVDMHWWDLAKAAGLSTLLFVCAELAMDDEDELIQALQSGAQDTINNAGQEIIRRQLNVAPTLTIRPGFPMRVMITRDLVLEPYGTDHDKAEARRHSNDKPVKVALSLPGRYTAILPPMPRCSRWRPESLRLTLPPISIQL